MDVNGRTVSLVLGSGGARGMAHIGVIYELLAAGCDIRAISGCSVGALVGGAYAAGKLEEFEAWMRSITAFNMISLMDLTWRSGGLIAGDKVIEGLTRIIGNRDIETLPVAFTAVAANLTLEKEAVAHLDHVLERAAHGPHGEQAARDGPAGRHVGAGDGGVAHDVDGAVRVLGDREDMEAGIRRQGHGSAAVAVALGEVRTHVLGDARCQEDVGVVGIVAAAAGRDGHGRRRAPAGEGR